MSLEQLGREGIEALRRGDGSTAVARLEAYKQQVQESEIPWLALAQAYRLTGEDEKQEGALNRHLADNMRDLLAMLLMGDLKAKHADDRAALSWYQAALNSAAASADVPQQLHPMLAQAQKWVEAASLRFEAHLSAILHDVSGGQGTRMTQAVDLLLGRKQLYLQQPSSFYFPGLPQRQFYEREEFDWLADVEARVPEMREELIQIIADDKEFEPYVSGAPNRPRPANALFGDPSWGALYLWKDGAEVKENAARAPAAMAALALAPMPKIEQRSPVALYSLLKPGTHIQPHHGLLNTRLICHIPLIAPLGCGLRVGNETREWRLGEALIFDDSIEHEAWNRGTETRVVLLFEIWRPEISVDERAALTSIFEAINAYQGAPLDQG